MIISCLYVILLSYIEVMKYVAAVSSLQSLVDAFHILPLFYIMWQRTAFGTYVTITPLAPLTLVIRSSLV
jgi:hypothetical protein